MNGWLTLYFPCSKWVECPLTYTLISCLWSKDCFLIPIANCTKESFLFSVTNPFSNEKENLSNYINLKISRSNAVHLLHRKWWKNKGKVGTCALLVSFFVAVGLLKRSRERSNSNGFMAWKQLFHSNKDGYFSKSKVCSNNYYIDDSFNSFAYINPFLSCSFWPFSFFVAQLKIGVKLYIWKLYKIF